MQKHGAHRSTKASSIASRASSKLIYKTYSTGGQGFRGNIPIPFGNVGFNFGGQSPGRPRRPGRPHQQQRPQPLQQNTPQTFERG